MPHRETRSNPPLPTGWRRLAARTPVFLFRAGLGPVMGERFLLLHHVGRRTGLDRQAVLEVVAHEAPSRSWTVAAGFGPASDWFRNLRAHPKTVIQSGNRHHAVTAVFLSADEGADIMAEYARRHPRAARRLCGFLGLPADRGDRSYREAGRAIPFVRLEAFDPQHPPR
ncbi:nitroreductase family deazaflavin-dependent oxidoreductase [Streptomyces sp. T028]|uniref:nitroreductase family deazaflavin-dependent oxidoreductase n=1 Tax=Streptomyces sp. T028 TaxID=3394379 RepID=UPI003A86B64F